MFEQVFENVRRATEFNIRTQQRLLRKWASLCGVPASPNVMGEHVAKIQEQWMEFVTDLVKRRREGLEPHFKASLTILEEACCLVDAKDPEELRTKTMELWQKSLQCLRQFCETQMVDLETAITKWIELVTEASTAEVGQILREAEAPAA
jgi:hypothetical protein